MPVERRIREGSQRNAAILEPDVDRSLGLVVRKARRRSVVRRSLTVAVAVPAIVLGIVVGPRMLESIQGSGRTVPAIEPTPVSEPSVSAFAGSFTRTLTADTAVVRVNGIAGQWTISSDDRGRVRIVAPSSFAGAQVSRPFELQGNTMQTTVFSPDVCSGLPAGTYSWVRVDGALVFTAVSDPCDARVQVLAGGPWRAIS